MVGLDKKIDLMLKYNISEEQWFFLELLWVAQNEELGAKYFYKYFSERQIRHNKKPGVSFELLNDLSQKDIITTETNLDIQSITDIDAINLNLASEFFIDLGVQGLEFWDAYPAFSTGAVKYQLKNLAKHFTSKDEFLAFYGRRINYSPELHEKNMKALNKAISLDLANCTIYEWVVSEKWNEFEELEEKQNYVDDI